MTSKLNEKNRVKSNICRTMGGHEMANRRRDTKPCMLERNIFRDWATDTRGGKSNVEEKTANRMRANVHKPKISGSWLGGHGLHSKFCI
jgi:hypothetical protein